VQATRLVAALTMMAALVLASTMVPAKADRDVDQIDAKVEAIMAIDGDPAYGEFLGSECATCHRRSAPSESIPPISGMDEHHFVRALVEYREGVRSNEVMRTTAARLSDEEIAALAAHFAAREPR